MAEVIRDIAMDRATARQMDGNSFYEIKGNPISKVGIFPYLGSSLAKYDADGNIINGIDPDKVYQVLRPPEELSHPDCIESFKLLPWVDEHTMVGKGFTPAEQKGVHGVIGQDVYFDAPYLRGNLKLFSENLDQMISTGEKKELSAGYFCQYEISSGNWNGQRYDAIQRNIRGNHLASVPAGRMGPDVAVLDHLSFTFDAREIMAEAESKKEPTLSEVMEMLKSVVPQMTAINESIAKLTPSVNPTVNATVDGDDKDDKKEDKEDKKGKAEDDKEDTDNKDDKKEKAMDAALTELRSEFDSYKKDGIKSVLKEVSARDALANQLAPLVGTFDHSEMTTTEVAKYGVEKLEIKCEAGQEIPALNGYLQAAKPHVGVIATDAAPKKSTEIDDYFSGKKA